MTITSVENDIVISGMSGRFPESDNVEEFKEHLLNNEDMTTIDDRRWPPGTFGVPDRSGKLKDLTKFDASFFSIHSRLANIMDPTMRILLETIFETIVDAGLNPEEVRGTKTGIFLGMNTVEASAGIPYTLEELNNSYIKIGTHTSMLANRMSFAFDLKGPSSVIDSGCSSSIVALHNAVQSIKRGESDMAVVCSSSVILAPNSIRVERALHLLGESGNCHGLDDDYNGIGHGEAVVAVLLQKSRSAKRVYATILNTGVNCNGLNKVEGEMERRLVEKVHRDIGLSPLEVDYVEVQGIRKKNVTWIQEVYCQGRDKPLLMGCTNSNTGYSMGTSGLTSLVKMIIAMESGVIPANLHGEGVAGLRNDRIQPVEKNWAWNGGIVAINSLSYGGVNAIVVLKSQEKRAKMATGTIFPRLVCASARTHDAVEHLLKKVSNAAKDEDFIALVQSVFQKPIPNHLYRGYAVLDGSKPEINDSPIVDGRQKWFIFPGVGSEDLVATQKLMKLEPFRDAMMKCSKVLSTVDFDLLAVVEKNREENDISFRDGIVVSTCTQMALVDTLRALGVLPDFIIGHSLGETSCAYADGAASLEQMALGIHSVAGAISESNCEPGAMAAVGLSPSEAAQLCSGTDVVVACHNAANSTTISGPHSDVKALVEKLKSKGIFAREIDCSNIGFHSPCLLNAIPLILSRLQKIIAAPKRRTQKWLSTSVPESDWNSGKAQWASAEYFASNLISPVLFHEITKKIPENALIIEISPNSIFQRILQLTAPKSSIIIGLARKNTPDHVSYFLSSLGKVYSAGIDLNLGILNPFTTFPVPQGTPSLSSLIQWDHSTSWDVHSFTNQQSGSNGSVFSVNLAEKEFEFLEGHRLDGRVLIPAAAYLNFVWQAFAKAKQTPQEKTPVVFENVAILRPTTITKDEPIKFMVNVSTITGKFEVTESGSTVANGNILLSQGLAVDGLNNLSVPSSLSPEGDYLDLSKNDVYTELRLRGYDYQGQFQGIESSDNHASTGTLAWNSNWTVFMDLILQYSCFGLNTRELHLPTKILKFIVDPEAHIAELNGRRVISVHVHRNICVVRSGGLEMRGLKTCVTPRMNTTKGQRKLEEYTFVPYERTKEILPYDEVLSVFLQITLENCRNTVKLMEIDDESASSMIPSIASIVSQLPSSSVDLWRASTGPLDPSLNSLGVRLITGDARHGPVDSSESFDLVCGNRLSNTLQNVIPSVAEGGFILSRESPDWSLDNGEKLKCCLERISTMLVESEEYVLMRKSKDWKIPKVIQIETKDFSWINSVKTALQEERDTSVLLVGAQDPTNGIIGLFNCIKQEPGGERFRVVFTECSFNLTENQNQLKKDLLVNVYKNNTWGSLRHLNYESRNMTIVDHAYVNSLKRGDLSSLRWFESPNSLLDDKALCTVYYAALNFKDIMLASGKLSPDSIPHHRAEMDSIMGLEFAGRDNLGHRVMGFVEAQALATSVMAIPPFLWKVPQHWSLEQASTVPTVYARCIYALIMRGNMRTGESLLVHDGSDGMGQAAVTLALHLGVKVFTTVGSHAEKEFLLERFPELNEGNIGNSRDTTFEQWILDATDGQGVDIVLNSLTDDKLQASVRCLAEHGRFLEIGTMDLDNNSTLGMSHFLKNVSFHGILLDSLFDAPEHVKSELAHLLQKYIDCGAVQPLPVTKFDCSQIEGAFRFMASEKFFGKVVIKIKDEETDCVVQNAQPARVPAIRRTYFNPKKSYLILGGLGGFGLELCDWMLKRGAGHVILTSRSGVTSGHQSYMLRRWADKGHRVKAMLDDVSHEEDAVKLIEYANTIGPVGGIFNLAAVLRDSVMVNQTQSNFEIVSKLKISATSALDKASRRHCSQLDHFVCFSSVFSERGNRGQSSYGFDNSTMERICETRFRDGLPGMAIQWEAFEEFGMSAGKVNEDVIVGGNYSQEISSCLDALDLFLRNPRPVVASCVVPETSFKIPPLAIVIPQDG